MVARLRTISESKTKRFWFVAGNIKGAVKAVPESQLETSIAADMASFAAMVKLMMGGTN